MYSANDINKIYLSSNMTLKKVNITTLLFNNSEAVSKKKYSIVDRFINVVDPVVDSLSLIKNVNSCYYYEYRIFLDKNNTEPITISGIDIFGNNLLNLINKTILVFVDGIKLFQTDINIDYATNSIIIPAIQGKKEINVILYISDTITYSGLIFNRDNIIIDDYSNFSYIFFKNGKLIPHNLVKVIGNIVILNTEYIQGVDTIEYFNLPKDTEILLFEEEPGYFSYGTTDNYNVNVPELYDTIATFNTIARLAIDDIRKGFFIRENNNDGILSIIQDTFETCDVKCITLKAFHKQTYSKEDYYVQVPEAKSILKYLGEFDLKGKLFPELLGIFQKLLLDETYDSVQRLKNIRSINNVDSGQINNLISFLGLKINLTNTTLEQKHALLEELNNFYNIVGTKPSYSFYNLLNTDVNIIKMEQLFTPIKDISESENAEYYGRRYVTFKTPEELGGEYIKEYRLPIIDYGSVDEIANMGESKTNEPSSEGILTNPDGIINLYRPGSDTPEQTYNVAILKTNELISDVAEREVYLNNPNFDVNEGYDITNIDNLPCNLVKLNINTNLYTTDPMAGPNLPTIDYGTITPINGSTTEYEEASAVLNYGYVDEEIKGKWIEWLKWNRVKDWYPTNHVTVSLSIPPSVDYDTFMKEFKSTFYNIASTVVYIHNVIETYSFSGNDDNYNNYSDSSKSQGINDFSMLSAPLYNQIEFTFTNDPARQIAD